MSSSPQLERIYWRQRVLSYPEGVQWMADMAVDAREAELGPGVLTPPLIGPSLPPGHRTWALPEFPQSFTPDDRPLQMKARVERGAWLLDYCRPGWYVGINIRHLTWDWPGTWPGVDWMSEAPPTVGGIIELVDPELDRPHRWLDHFGYDTPGVRKLADGTWERLDLDAEHKRLRGLWVSEITRRRRERA